MNLELHLRVAGVLQLFLALIHVYFPKRFAWKEELGRLSLINKQMFLVHTFYLCLVLTMFGALSLFAPQTLLESSLLSKLVNGALALFWGLRLVFQWFVYDSSLWRGNRFNTAVHFAFTVLWFYLSSVYGYALLR